MKYIVERTDGDFIHPDEPCFVVRAQDKYAVSVVRFYRDLLESEGAPGKFIEKIEEHLDKLLAWQHLNKDKVKFPD